MSKPLAKSLHTVTVLVRVAKELQNRQFPPLESAHAIGKALSILGLVDVAANDAHDIIGQALKQLNK